ncbi:MAG: FKBP-type peptidyl-prolyl cis-trans isomerase [Propionibacteriales bacterium]|nr:FKBP-type peptidyl-prolyl cis-trans isomerase [Propionibacteriales bacterium]
MSRTARLRLLVPIAVCSLLLGLAACGDKKDTVKDSGAKAPTELVLKVLKEGTGAVVQSGDSVTVDYQGTNWTNGEVFDQSYGKQPATFTTDGVVPGFGAALVGQKVGAQVVVGIPPEFGYGAAGQPSAGIAGTDTLVFVIEIKATGLEIKQCDAKPGALSNSVTVAGAFGKKATATFAKPLKATTLQRTVVKTGSGAKTKAGDNVNLLITIFNGRTGKLIDSSPGTLKVGDQNVPEQFQAGLSCIKVGSRVVTTFPAKAMFGAAGNPSAGIKANDSLVLVTDLIKTVAPVAPAALPATKAWDDAPTVTFNGTAAPTLTLPKS